MCISVCQHKCLSAYVSEYNGIRQAQQGQRRWQFPRAGVVDFCEQHMPAENWTCIFGRSVSVLKPWAISSAAIQNILIILMPNSFQQLLPDLLFISLSIQLCVISFQINHLRFWSLYALGCVAIQWCMVHLKEVTPLKKTQNPSMFHSFSLRIWSIGLQLHALMKIIWIWLILSESFTGNQSWWWFMTALI